MEEVSQLEENLGDIQQQLEKVQAAHEGNEMAQNDMQEKTRTLQNALSQARSTLEALREEETAARVQAATEEKELSALTHEQERRYHVPFAKVYRKGTIVNEFFYNQSVFGVYVDIFPLDGIKSSRQAYWCGQCIRFMYIKTSIFNNRQTLMRKARLAVTKLILLP